jgi:hypothetical protein
MLNAWIGKEAIVKLKEKEKEAQRRSNIIHSKKYSIYPSEESIPSTICGDAVLRMVWLRAPVPHPTSNQLAHDGTSRQVRKWRATSLLHRPT